MNTLKKFWKLGAAGALIGAIAAASVGVAATSAMAQTPTPPTPQAQRGRGPQSGAQDRSAAPSFDGRGGPGMRAGQAVTVTGAIKEYTLSPMGDYEGFALADGTRVDVPPADAVKVKDLFPVGSAVTVQGIQHPGRPGPKADTANAPVVVRAETITSGSNSYTVEKPTTPPTPPTHEVVTQTSTIASLSTNANGDVDGFVLADKTVVRTPPHESATLKDKLTLGATVEVTGDKHVGNSGLTVIRAQTIKVNGETIFSAPADRGPRGGRGHGGPGGFDGPRGPMRGGPNAPQQSAPAAP